MNLGQTQNLRHSRLQTTEFLNDLQKDAKILKVSDSSVD